jgi:hypothetical protein
MAAEPMLFDKMNQSLALNLTRKQVHDVSTIYFEESEGLFGRDVNLVSVVGLGLVGRADHRDAEQSEDEASGYCVESHGGFRLSHH